MNHYKGKGQEVHSLQHFRPAYGNTGYVSGSTTGKVDDKIHLIQFDQADQWRICLRLYELSGIKTSSKIVCLYFFSFFFFGGGEGGGKNFSTVFGLGQHYFISPLPARKMFIRQNRVRSSLRMKQFYCVTAFALNAHYIFRQLLESVGAIRFEMV